MEYRFKYQIVDEDDNVVSNGSTYLVPEDIQPMGSCESVDMEVGAGLRAFRKVYRIEEEERQRYLDDEGNDVRDLAEKAEALRDAQREDGL